MQTFSASALVLALYAAALVPIVVAAALPRTRFWMAGTCVVAMLGIGFFQTGMFQRGDLTNANVVAPTLATADEGRCKQVLQVLDRADIVPETNETGEITIKGVAADQIPPEVRDILIECAERQSPDAGAVLPDSNLR
jgi:hypothetical protein